MEVNGEGEGEGEGEDDGRLSCRLDRGAAETTAKAEYQSQKASLIFCLYFSFFQYYYYYFFQFL